MQIVISIVLLAWFYVLSCNSHPQAASGKAENLLKANYDSSVVTIHVFVALCDNKYQGILKVPAKIGNGQDPKNNLYWGCAYGVKTFFMNSLNWEVVRDYKLDSIRLERMVFKHKKLPAYLIADAYDGKEIRQCTNDFLNSCAGRIADTLILSGKAIGIYGNSRLLAYAGHDGLMEFELTGPFESVDHKNRSAIILACTSKTYFARHLLNTGAHPLIWTTDFMSPEAYTLHDAVESFLMGTSHEEIGRAAAMAYAKYQKCSEQYAAKLIVTGW